jgi:hypothetical protein
MTAFGVREADKPYEATLGEDSPTSGGSGAHSLRGSGGAALCGHWRLAVGASLGTQRECLAHLQCPQTPARGDESEARAVQSARAGQRLYIPSPVTVAPASWRAAHFGARAHTVWGNDPCNIMREFDSVHASRAPSLHRWTPYAGNGSKRASSGMLAEPSCSHRYSAKRVSGR